MILAHSILEPISDAEIYEALPETYQGIPTHIYHVGPFSKENEVNRNLNWASQIAAQERFFEENISKKLKEHADYTTLYFGTAPIPLAMHLGYKVQSFRKVQIFLKDHNSKNWKWGTKEAGPPLPSEIPSETFKGKGEVTLRMGTSFRINEEDTDSIVPLPIKEIEIYPKVLGRNIFGSHEQLIPFTEAFRKALDAVSSHLPGANAIHLFAAIPVGLAFLMGQEINPNAHPLVHLYSFSKGDLPAYDYVFTVNEAPNMEVMEITGNEKKAFEKLRGQLKDHLEKEIKNYILRVGEESESNWFKALYPDAENPLFDLGHWQYLARLDKTTLKYSAVAESSLAPTEDQFYQNGEYYFSDFVLKALSGNLSNSADKFMACRLFFFHETIHHSTHQLRSENASGISRYPRVVEEADYQADVYALLHEFHYTRPDKKQAKGYFLRMINALTETMWAFVKQNKRPHEMEIQKVNRLLTWYYLACWIESESCQDVEGIFNLLSVKPILELRLNGVSASNNQKLLFNFKRIRPEELGICVFHHAKIQSQGNDLGQLPLTDLVEGFRTKAPEKIKNTLRALLAKLPK